MEGRSALDATTCDACGLVVFVDATGNGVCPSCGAHVTSRPSIAAEADEAEADEAPAADARAKSAFTATWSYLTGPIVPEVKIRKARRIHQRLIAFAGAALAIILVGAVLVNVVIRARMIPAAPVHRYIDGDSFFRIDVPDEWMASEAGTDPFATVVFSDPASRATATVQYAKPAVGGPADAARTYLDTFVMQGGTASNRQGPTMLDLAGESWTQYAADETIGGSPQQFHIVVLAAIHGDYLVMIALSDASSAFERTNARDFQPMLNGFAFLR